MTSLVGRSFAKLKRSCARLAFAVRSSLRPVLPPSVTLSSRKSFSAPYGVNSITKDTSALSWLALVSASSIGKSSVRHPSRQSLATRPTLRTQSYRCCINSKLKQLSNTYDHTHWRTRDPVRSPIDKPVRARLVVGSVTTSESLVLYVFLSSFFFPLDPSPPFPCFGMPINGQPWVYKPTYWHAGPSIESIMLFAIVTFYWYMLSIKTSYRRKSML